jgi:hypothetical protein
VRMSEGSPSDWEPSETNDQDSSEQVSGGDGEHEAYERDEEQPELERPARGQQSIGAGHGESSFAQAPYHELCDIQCVPVTLMVECSSCFPASSSLFTSWLQTRKKWQHTGGDVSLYHRGAVKDALAGEVQWALRNYRAHERWPQAAPAALSAGAAPDPSSQELDDFAAFCTEDSDDYLARY